MDQEDRNRTLPGIADKSDQQKPIHVLAAAVLSGPTDAGLEHSVKGAVVELQGVGGGSVDSTT